MKKIVLTGGHFTPGLALIGELKKKNWEIYWIGDSNSLGAKSVKSLEARVLPKLGIPFYSLTTLKIFRNNKLLVLLNIWKIPVGLLQSLYYLLIIRPDVVLSFGSYVSFPVLSCAYILGISIVIHEQTAVSGMANRILSKLAKFVAISFSSSYPFFPKGKTFLTGNLVRKSFWKIAENKTYKQKIGEIFFLGGSRGSQTINKVIFKLVNILTKKYTVYHQTGSVDYNRALKVKENLSQANNYYIYETIDPLEIEKRYFSADLMISRSGANTVSEIAVIGIPAIFIPLPFADSDEQTKNAELLAKYKSALILPQAKLTPNSLLEKIETIDNDLEKYNMNCRKTYMLVPKDSISKLIRLIEKAVL